MADFWLNSSKRSFLYYPIERLPMTRSGSSEIGSGREIAVVGRTTN
jgi:hypothetical protein